MPRAERIRLERVELLPCEIREGVLYVSDKYRTAVHLCCCGCGAKVVTPLKPYAWTLTARGNAASLHPSIGSWSLPCKSHYWIRGGRVEWAGAMTDDEIRRVQALDQRAQEAHFRPAPSPSLWACFIRWLKSLW
jgi:uncharacterized protein DUF6527